MAGQSYFALTFATQVSNVSKFFFDRRSTMGEYFVKIVLPKNTK